MAKIVIDGTRTQTARTVLVAAFAAVAVLLLAALGIHRLRSRGMVMDLPGSLGANISQTANGFTYSQSQQGRTVFTIHASSITQFKGDQAELHGVEITLYGPQGSGRRDHIAGADFLYDKASGEITAKGAVSIDMAAPNANADSIHVETSALRYSQKTGRAHTAALLTFTVPRAGGKAVGGTYDAHSGVLVLDSAVELHAAENGIPATTFATHAEFSRDAHAAYLLNVHSTFNGLEMVADQAILHFRPDGTLLHIDAENRVNVRTAEGSHLYATNASVDLNAQSEPLTAYAGGGVNYHSATPELELHGNAVESTLSFAPGPDGKQQLRHAQFRNAVSFVLQENSFVGDPRGLSTREITASKIDIGFAPSSDGRSEARQAVADGNAKVDLHDLPFSRPQSHSTIYADKLTTVLTDGHRLARLDGSGGTKAVDYAPDGSFQASTGETLHVTFLPMPLAHERTGAGRGVAPPSDSAAIDTAEQSGAVTLTAQPARDAKTAAGTPQQPFFAEGTKAVYRASDSTLRLTGDPTRPPRVHNDALSLTAAEVAVARNSGTAVAQGDVRATYLQQPVPTPGTTKLTPGPALGGAGAVHVTGSSATLSRATDTATFLGTLASPARIWQGGNSVSAPVLDFTRQSGVLSAHAPDERHAPAPGPEITSAGKRTGALPAGADSAATVHTVFAGQGGVTRVSSATLLYADSTRTASFGGPVVAQQPAGEFRADSAQLFLAEAPAGQPSRLDHITAAGRVSLTAPGRRGTGDKLLYTAADSSYLLTGGPPRATDAEHGTITGAELLFKAGENSVEVLSQSASGPPHRTATDTRTPN